MEAVLAKDSARTSRAAWLWEARDHPGRFHASMSRFLRRLRGPSRVTHMLLLLHWKVGWERELSWGETQNAPVSVDELAALQQELGFERSHASTAPRSTKKTV